MRSSPDIAKLKALAEPNRIKIVEILSEGPLTVGQIAKRLGLRQPQASKHLKVLSENQILEVKAIANRRIYQLRPEPFQELNMWLNSIQRVTEARFDRLDVYLRELKANQNNNSKENL